MRPSQLLSSSTLIALGFFAGVANGATITLDVVADTYLRQNQAGTVKNNDAQLLVGSVLGTALRPLLRFDTTALSTLGPVQINSVTLSVTNTGTNGAGGAHTISVYNYDFDFVENSATWNNPAGNGTDPLVGGTIGSTLLADLSGHSRNANAAATFSSTPAFSTFVESALSGDNTINLILQGAIENNSNNYYRFRDRESFNSGFFQLTVDYTIIPEPHTALLISMGSLFLFRRRR